MRLGFATFLGLALLAAGPAAAQEARVDRVEISNYGLYHANKAGIIPDAGTTTGTTTLLTNVDFYEVTNMVPACLGVGFGYMIRPVGTPDGYSVSARSIWQLPAPGLKNPETGKTYRQSVSEFQMPLGQLKLRGYTFDREWEMVPGDWTLEIWNAGRRLIVKTFTVYRASCPDLAS